MDLVAGILIVAGLLFLAVSAAGLVLFPDFYTRAHVVAKSETFGVVLVVLGAVVDQRFGGGSVRLLLLVAFAAVANPTAIHALARAYSRERDDGAAVPGFPVGVGDDGDQDAEPS